jgi:hypothetical protein
LNFAGGIWNRGVLTLDDCVVSHNGAGGFGRGGAGGGIDNFGTLTINNSTISGNVALGGGGAIANIGTLAINNSTIYGNSAYDSDGYGMGGGISNDGILTINNSTIAGNQAGADMYGSGGGIYNSIDGSVIINNSAISHNYAGQAGAGISNRGGMLNMRNSIVAGNQLWAYDLDGNVGSQGHNLFGTTYGGSGFDPTDLLNVDPLLGPLQDNGGPTLTMALLDGSPAIDAGDNTDVPDWDQRGPGFPRITPDDPVIDIGAFEVQQDGGNGPGRPVPLHAKSVRLDVAAVLVLAISSSPALSSSPTPGNVQLQTTLAGPQVAVVDRLFASLDKADAGLGVRKQVGTFIASEVRAGSDAELGRFSEIPIRGPLSVDVDNAP